MITGKNFKEGESILKELINPSGEEFRYYKYEKAMHKKNNEWFEFVVSEWSKSLFLQNLLILNQVK